MTKKSISAVLACLLIFTAASLAQAQSASEPFVGGWSIADAKQGGSHFEDDVGCSVTITTNGRTYHVAGLEDMASRMDFTRQGNSLQGDYVADFKYLVKHYSRTFSEGVLSQASGRVNYHCSIVSDGRGLICKCDNAKLTANTLGIYFGSEPVHGYYEWYLERD